jgi:hypothetical protein
MELLKSKGQEIPFCVDRRKGSLTVTCKPKSKLRGSMGFDGHIFSCSSGTVKYAREENTFFGRAAGVYCKT